MSGGIGVCGLRKSYGKTVALDGLDLSVAEGEVHGFLGPNGSGKPPGIRILLGLLRADGGSQSAGWVAIPGRRPLSCTAGSLTCPVMSACGPTSPAAR